mmetsp:Transcript_30986/g.64317  ORF Transcript_30986/g.64317 Transcript_30986/m.64317 type:complete len:143 (-) Transcript_30986:210-638(-)
MSSKLGPSEFTEGSNPDFNSILAKTSMKEEPHSNGSLAFGEMNRFPKQRGNEDYASGHLDDLKTMYREHLVMQDHLLRSIDGSLHRRQSRRHKSRSLETQCEANNMDIVTLVVSIVVSIVVTICFVGVLVLNTTHTFSSVSS